MIQNQSSFTRKVYFEMNCPNKSFLDVHYFLKKSGIQNNRFFLVLLDPDLAHIDPRDPTLNTIMRAKVLKECMYNYWYFLRRVVQLPDQGGAVGSGKPYGLNRGNLALNYCIQFNLNVFAEFPRQQGKTTAVLCRILWEFLFGTTNSKMIFINKKHDDSKMNLQSLREIRDALPPYLIMKDVYGADGKKVKVKDSVITLENPNNNNKILTLPAARNKVAANSLGRGMTIPRIWYDEYAFIPYNDIVYQASTPAFKTASQNARNNGKPFGIIITTTPGDLTTEMGMEADRKRNLATPFSERWYDFSEQQLRDTLAKNTKSKFVYVRYTYQQLIGKDAEKWFKDICLEMELNWTAIRREVLLEWAKSSDNSPFNPEDLETIKGFIKQPIRTIPMLNGAFEFLVYEDIDLSNPPIAGVDVSGGFRRDASSITLIDSKTTKVFAVFNCNYINTLDMARLLLELTKVYMPNLVINIERNGGFGSSVIANLMSTSIKKNLYYEIKDKVIEERTSGPHMVRKTQKTKVYGTDNTHNTRELLIDILRQRVDMHKDKFVSQLILDELMTLEVKKNGRVEHTDTGHDDQVFSYLMALYVWYEGTDLMERYGIRKSSLKTDADLEEAVTDLEEKYSSWQEELDLMKQNCEDDPAQVQEQLDYLNSNKAIMYEDWLKAQKAEDEARFNEYMSRSKKVKKAYIENYHVDPEELENGGQVNMIQYINNYYADGQTKDNDSFKDPNAYV